MIRIKYLRQEFIVIHWSETADDYEYVLQKYPVEVHCSELTSLHIQWLQEITATLGPVLIPPGKMNRPNRRLFKACVE